MTDQVNMAQGKFDQLTSAYLVDESELVTSLLAQGFLKPKARKEIGRVASDLVRAVRADKSATSTIDDLLLEYGLSSDEGVTLMRLAEALIRTPDFATSRSLIRDKIGGAKWSAHAGKSHSFLVNQATNGLRFTAGWVAATGGAKTQNLIAKLGDAVMETAVERAMAIMGEHFVLGRDIERALTRAEKSEAQGFTHSYDMLGEAAHTRKDADEYFGSYLNAMSKLAEQSSGQSEMIKSAGLSVKLSALHPRYEFAQRETCVPELVDRLTSLAAIARDAGLWLNIDAEEADRLEISLIVFEQLLKVGKLGDWPGLGLVIQAYQRRALPVIKHVDELTRSHNRRIAVRLVKGAYWDMEIKRAQELGLASYPVFTRKENTDLSYLACANALFKVQDRIFPQFATHNAHTAAAIAHLGRDGKRYEFQRLHGMGASLHRQLMMRFGTASRVYAPVGTHKDLLPYLVRRLLENGANSSFVNQLMDDRVAIDDIVTDPLKLIEQRGTHEHPKIPTPIGALGGQRLSARGIDLTQSDLEFRFEAVAARSRQHNAQSQIAAASETEQHSIKLNAPQNPNNTVGEVSYLNPDLVDQVVSIARDNHWGKATSAECRSAILDKAADLLEEEMDDFLELCVREAGKTLPDAVAEVREAVDFCRYYSLQAKTRVILERRPLGVVACISPWNFPLAIFIGQIVAALSVGNAVVAKPAEQTPIIATRAVDLLYRAGVPRSALQLIIGDGAKLGNALTRHPDVDGVCFTGSTRTAKIIAENLADTGRSIVPMIAETGGLNAMIVDSTALLEQAVQDAVDSAFQSAGQRCSACRVVCVQNDVFDAFKEMLIGAMDELIIGDPACLKTDVGPVIDQSAKAAIDDYREEWQSKGKVAKTCQLPADLDGGYYTAPTLIELEDITELEREVFGPILHLVRFKTRDVSGLVEKINSLGYGLTLGLHTRLDGRVNEIAATAHVGNIYVNRNQIGAVVGVHPFGGEGLSGTGPKAGGPNYLYGLTRHNSEFAPELVVDAEVPYTPIASKKAEERILTAKTASKKWQSMRDLSERRQLLSTVLGKCNLKPGSIKLDLTEKWELPGPTGEKNTLTLFPRGVVLCFGGDNQHDLNWQIARALIAGSAVIAVQRSDEDGSNYGLAGLLETEGVPTGLVQFVTFQEGLSLVDADIEGVFADGSIRALVGPPVCRRSGAILPLLSKHDPFARSFHERTLTVNTTAAGGNASLLALDS